MSDQSTEARLKKALEEARQGLKECFFDECKRGLNSGQFADTFIAQKIDAALAATPDKTEPERTITVGPHPAGAPFKSILNLPPSTPDKPSASNEEIARKLMDKIGVALEISSIVKKQLLYPILLAAIQAARNAPSEDTKRLLESAQKVAQIYFNIAADVIGEDEVRRRRDAAIDATIKEEK